MPGPTNTLLIEGSFEELADELAHYIDEVKKKSSEDGSGVQSEIASLLEQGQKDEALKKIVTGSTILNTAPEKGFLLSQDPTASLLCLQFFLSRVRSGVQPACTPCSPIAQPR